MELTFTILLTAVKLAHKICTTGEWISAGTAAWLLTLCLNNKTVTNVLESASCARRLHTLEHQTRPNMVELAALRKLKRDEPKLMATWTPPAVL
jgi:hypothetical protein